MTATEPLLVAALDDVVARRGRTDISARSFLRDVQALAATLPASGHVLNLCTDRYRFAVGLAAAIVRAQVSVLPSTVNATTVRQLAAEHPDLYCLAETPQAEIDLRQVVFDDATRRLADDEVSMPRIPVDRVVAYVFTSGSTGVPTRHRKLWGSLVRSARIEGRRVRSYLAEDVDARLSIVATVPPQHMYGLESSVLIAWQSRATLVAERPFFPADIVATLEASPAPRVLVTTPFHLRALLSEATALPRVALVLCATAPLSASLAGEAEQRFGAPIAEIYGCTETGQIATRRPTVDAHWTLFDDVRVQVDGDEAVASGGHVDAPTRLVDCIALADDYETTHRFALVGRSQDLVNIAGKRTSIGFLDAQLHAIDGVVDGAFFRPEDDAVLRDGVSRLGAVVVAPSLTPQRLLDALRVRIDRAFLPRPLHFVDALPRNATGKLTDATLRSIVADCIARGRGAEPTRDVAPRARGAA